MNKNHKEYQNFKHDYEENVPPIIKNKPVKKFAGKAIVIGSNQNDNGINEKPKHIDVSNKTYLSYFI